MELFFELRVSVVKISEGGGVLSGSRGGGPMADKGRARTVRKGAQALKREAHDLTHEAILRPAVDRVVHVMRERPVVVMVAAAGLVLLGALLATRHRHAEN
jgi:hypothetical protein